VCSLCLPYAREQNRTLHLAQSSQRVAGMIRSSLYTMRGSSLEMATFSESHRARSEEDEKISCGVIRSGSCAKEGDLYSASSPSYSPASPPFLYTHLGYPRPYLPTPSPSFTTTSTYFPLCVHLHTYNLERSLPLHHFRLHDLRFLL